MDEQLQGLLDRIKAEGVERAEAEAARIVREDEATSMRRGAESDAAAAFARGQTALEQAGRDFLLALQRSIEALLRETLCTTVAEALTPELMAGILARLADAYAAHDMNESRVDVLLSPEDRDAVGAIVMEEYRELVKQGLTLRADERMEAGFKVSFVDYHLYHDFSAEALADALAPVLKPPLCDIVRRAAVERA
jgi:V/A-type H+-transporting ATPase subunit E